MCGRNENVALKIQILLAGVSDKIRKGLIFLCDFKSSVSKVILKLKENQTFSLIGRNNKTEHIVKENTFEYSPLPILLVSQLFLLSLTVYIDTCTFLHPPVARI